MKRFSLLPFLISFATGIQISFISGYLFYIGTIILLISISAWLYLSFIKVSPLRRMKLNRLNLFLVMISFMGAGIIAGEMSNPEIPTEEEIVDVKAIYGKISDKRNSTSGDVLTINVKSLFNSDLEKINCSSMSVLIYLDHTEAQIDDLIVFPTELHRIEDSENSFDTGYSKLLENRGISYRGSTLGKDIRITSHIPSFRGFCRKIRDEFEKLIENTSLKTQTKNFLITILLGDRSYLTPDMRTLFSNSGIAHVLALSGMHIGIIAGIFMFILFPINFLGFYKYRSLIAVIMLWGYTMITGMAPSTIRACIMATFVMIALFLQRKNISFNALCASVLIILIFSPGSVNDIGLQLSFICVASLLVFSEKFNPIDRRLHNLTYTLMGIIVSSLVATTASWCVSAYHFNIFPLSFLPANFIVLPLLPLYIIIANIYLLMYLCGFQSEILNYILDSTLESFTGFIEWLENNLSAIHIGISSWTIIFWITAIVSTAFYLHHSNHSRKIVFLTICITAGIISAMIIPFVKTDYVRDGFIIRKDTYNISILRRQNGKDKILSIDRGKIMSVSFPHHQLISVDMPLNQNLYLKNLSSGLCDYLVIAGGYNGDLYSIYKIFHPKMIVIHPSVRKKKEQSLMEEAEKLSIELHSIRNQSSLKVNECDPQT